MKLKDCLEKLIALEEDAAKVYEKIAALSEGEVAEIAKEFQKEEINHIEKIKELAKDIHHLDTEITDEMMVLLESGLRSKRFSEEELTMYTRKELFLFALQSEKECILLYSEFAKLFKNPSSEYTFFQRLMEEERRHMFFVLKTLHELK